jgi:hypothetical protein
MVHRVPEVAVLVAPLKKVVPVPGVELVQGGRVNVEDKLIPERFRGLVFKALMVTNTEPSVIPRHL